MPRYFIRLAYNGAAYSGWQRQPNALSVQQRIEETLSLVLREEITITGCGRTDAGVHASDYFAHFDAEADLPGQFSNRLNRILPADVCIKSLYLTPAAAHARFDATRRSYRYDLSFQKDPFRRETITVYPFGDRPDPEGVRATAELITRYTAFAPFCKSNSDARTMNCTLFRSEWEFGKEQWSYHISANRFLRGMVRLIVGTCLEVGRGKLSLSAVERALARQMPLSRSWSAPAAGLFLAKITYPDFEAWQKVE